jgi:hypothetical protein
MTKNGGIRGILTISPYLVMFDPESCEENRAIIPVIQKLNIFQ